MSIPAESFQALEDAANRLASESILASPGRDDGLIPAYSLLGELIDLCELEASLREPLAAMRQALEARLDAALPFDEVTLHTLHELVEWLPAAIEDVRASRAVKPFSGLPAAGSDMPAPLPAAGSPGETTAAPAADVAEDEAAFAAAAAFPTAPAPAGEVATAAAAAPAETSTAVAAPELDTSVDVLLTLDLESNSELLGEFYAEAVDHLQQIEAALLLLDQQPDHPEALNSIFRSFHTIKGNAGFLGLRPMQSLAHEVESLLDLARNRELRLAPAIITEILRSRDALQALTQQVAVALEQGRLPDQVIPVSHLIRAVRCFATGSQVTPHDPAATGPAPVLVSPQPAAEVLEFTPAPAAAAAGIANLKSEISNPPPAPAAAAASSAAAAGAAASSAPSTAAQTVRVNTEKLDTLMDVVGELVIVQSQLIESAKGLADEGSPLRRNVAQLSRITKDLQHTAMSLRMIPIKPTFQKMERLARDLAQSCGKKVVFTTSGEDTELDRTVVEQLADPLVHMVRNALDHGLEPPEKRVAAGKSEAGSVHLHAYHQGGSIVVELRDDGRGIDAQKVLAKARNQGLVAPDAKLSDEEVFGLIFMPGFSTAEKVTAVSGRGVGMDVVKRNIEKLRGKIEISSTLGQGSVFKIKLPLTMAIIDGLVVRVGEDKFILPSTSVQMALRPSREQIVHLQGHGEVLDHRGRLLPLHRLHRRFGIPADAQQPWDGIVVVLETSGKVCALLVDDMLSKQEVVIKNLGAFLHGLPGVAGGAILGDGNIALILDPGSLLQAA